MESTQKIEKTLLFSGVSNSGLHLSGSFRKIEHQILNLFVGKEYRKIEGILSSFSSEVKAGFFEKHGYSILHYAATSSPDTEALTLILKNVQDTIVQKLLRHNDFEILEDLAGIKYSLETFIMPGQTEEDASRQSTLVSQKLEFLSRIDPKLLTDFLKAHGEKRYMSESVIQMIQSAIPMQTEKRSPPPETH